MAGMESDKNQKVFSMPCETQDVPDEARIAMRMWRAEARQQKAKGK